MSLCLDVAAVLGLASGRPWVPSAASTVQEERGRETKRRRWTQNDPRVAAWRPLCRNVGGVTVPPGEYGGARIHIYMCGPEIRGGVYHGAMHVEADRSPSLFVDAVEVPAFLDADRATAHAERLHRDRTIGASFKALNALQRVRAWRARVVPHSESELSLGRRLERGRRVIALLMIVIGALAGAGVATAVFHYDGTWPVNVVVVFATLVLLQLALVILTLILMLPSVPGIRVLQDLMGSLNPGALVAAIYRRFARLDNGRADLLAWSAARGPAVARFARWQTLVWSQLSAIAFNVAALAAAVALIAFTDLAFGWSTTLRMDGEDVLRITNTLAVPWAWFWSDAVPSATLIESSRFFRLASTPPLSSAEALTGWWPFLLAAIITYGLIPRCLIFIVALARLRAATEHLLLDDPQVRALLDRMNAAEVVLGADDVESADDSAAAIAARSPANASSEAVAVVWSGALPIDTVNDWALRNLRKQVMRLVEAGGGRALEDDAAAVSRIAEGRPRVVLLFVRAWEAPLLDLRDFIESLRAAVGGACAIVVVPVGPAGKVAHESQRTTWSRWVGRIGDPGLYMEAS